MWSQRYTEILFMTDFDYKPIAILANTAAIICDIIITVTAWTIILPYFWSLEYGWSTPMWVYRQIINIVVHTFPLIWSIINIYLLDDIVIYMSDIWLDFALTFTYMSINYLWSMETGKPVYGFMDFKTLALDDILYASATPIIGIGLHIFLAISTQALRGRWEWESPWFQNLIAAM